MTGDQLALPLPAGTLPALTLWQPWASAIFQAGKDVENRPWSTRYRGRLVIHAGRTFDRAGAKAFMGPLAALIDDCPRGVVLGTVTIAGCVRDSPSIWAVAGQWHWVLADPRLLAVPIPMPGRRGLWPISASLVGGRTG